MDHPSLLLICFGCLLIIVEQYSSTDRNMSSLFSICFIIFTSFTKNGDCGEHHEVATLLEPPFVMEKSTQSPYEPKYEGMLVDILDELARRLNFTYNIHEVYDGKFGYEVEPGKWDGLVSELINNQSDLALSHLTINSQRAKVVKFTQPFMLAGLRILYRPPDPLSNQEPWYILLTPFTAGLWVVIFVMWLVIGCLSYAIVKFSPFEDNSVQRVSDVDCNGVLCGKLLYTVCCILVQRHDVNPPRSPSGRFLASVRWLFCILTLITFTASLTAIFLTRDTATHDLPFRTFDEMSRQTRVQYGVYNPSLTLDYFKNSQQPMVKRMWQAMNTFQPSVFITSTKQGLDRLRDGGGNFAFIMEGPLAEFEAEKEPCDLVVLGNELDEQAYGFACRLEGDLCDRIDHKLLEMREEEFLYRVKVKWMYSGCKEKREQEVYSGGLSIIETFGLPLGGAARKSLTLKTFAAGFLVLFVGFAVTLLILGAEVTYARSRNVTAKFSVHQPMGNDSKDSVNRVSTSKLVNDDPLS